VDSIAHAKRLSARCKVSVLRSWPEQFGFASRPVWGDIFRELNRKETIMEITTPVGSILDNKGHQLWSIGSDATVYEAIALMAEKNVGALPVLDGKTLLGMISERDYTRKVILQGRVSRETRVLDIMTRNVITVSPEDSVEDCLETMTKNHIRHLPVVADEELAGLVSIGDLVNWIILAQSTQIDHLERYVTGSYPA